MSNADDVKQVDGDVPMDGENSSTQKEVIVPPVSFQ